MASGPGPAVGLLCGLHRQDREVWQVALGGAHPGQALLGHLCSAGTAPTTRWCPCCRAVVQCPRWWWRRGSSRSPVVRPPTGPWPPWPTYPAGVAMGGIYESTGDSACPPSLQLPSPGGAVKPSGVASGALPPPSVGYIPRCASQCIALTPVREVPWPQLPGKPRLAWGHWVTQASPSRGPCRLRLDGFSQPVIGAHLPAVGGGDPAVQHPGAGEDLQPAAGAPAHAPRALWGLPGP